MISAGDFRKGLTFEMDGHVYQVLDFQHVKPGKGAAFVRTKIKDIMNGGIKDVSFNPGDKYPRAHIDTKEMEYLYNDGELYYFMDSTTFDQIPLEYEQVEDTIKYIKENQGVVVKFYQEKAFDVEAPNFVELEVTGTEPGIKGDTSSGATKPATVETGAEVLVPLFVSNGDVIKIDTRTGDYMSRV